MDQIWLWIGFNAFVLAMLTLDLGVFHRGARALSVCEAAAWSAVWVTLALGFAGAVFRFMGERAGMEFLAGYLIEKALSVDNIFVFVLIFSYFRVQPQYQYRVLFWGILGALVMRGTMIGLGAYLIHRFEWVLYLFGAFLVWTGYRMATQGERPVEPESNPTLRLVRRLIPVSGGYDGHRFFTREPITPGGRVRWVATPLFVVLVLVESTDLIFAVDSIPAVFAVTRDPFLVYSSNVFAILGLRALYFLLSGVIGKFRYLSYGLSAVLVFVGGKMLLAGVHELPIGLSLGIIVLLISASIVASLLAPAPERDDDTPDTRGADTIRRRVEVTDPFGLTLRAAERFAILARTYQAEIVVFDGERQINGKSTADLASIQAPCGSWIEVEARGVDAREAISALAELFASRTTGTDENRGGDAPVPLNVAVDRGIVSGQGASPPALERASE